MASSSGNSTGSGSTESTLQIQNSDQDDLQTLMNERKRKRKQSNRESAKRSRMRKQKHMDDLMAQVNQLRKDNNQILSSINVTTQHSINIEADNSILRAQMVELNQRLESLNDILSLINNTTTTTTSNSNSYQGQGAAGIFDQTIFDGTFMMNSNLLYLNQPIMASADLFQY
ncbi:hypothetical protein ACFE04_012832 [Oxalis oulophora]